MELNLWKDQELNRLESFVANQNIPEGAADYIHMLIIRAVKYCGSVDESGNLYPEPSLENDEDLEWGETYQ